MIPPLQYISNGRSVEDHLKNIECCCKAGVSLIQLRLKNYPLSVVMEATHSAKKICRLYGALLLINDFVKVAKECDVDGVHLGQSDTGIARARKELGAKAMIGGTANNFEQIKRLADQKVDYIGLGPFRFTKTKKQLSPILGLKGYQKILQQMRTNGIHIPVFAVGGITLGDVKDLRKVGVNGIAVSTFLQEDTAVRVAGFYQELVVSY